MYLSGRDGEIGYVVCTSVGGIGKSGMCLSGGGGDKKIRYVVYGMGRVFTSVRVGKSGMWYVPQWEVRVFGYVHSVYLRVGGSGGRVHIM